MEFSNLGKFVFIAGLAIALVGLAIWLLGRGDFPLGDLPGDFRFKGERFSFYFPVVSMLIVSVVLTILVNVIMRFWEGGRVK